MIDEATTNVLGEMILLFDRLKDLASSTAQEIGVVFATPNGAFCGHLRFAIAVENIAANRIEELQFDSLASESKLLTKVMRRDEARSLRWCSEPDTSCSRGAD